jgi:hypothetical protein
MRLALSRKSCQLSPPTDRIEEMRMKSNGRWVVGIGLALAFTTAAEATPELAFRLTEGQNLNAFVRDGPVAAHLLLRNGQGPRILIAFPAGNSGVGLWFEPLNRPAVWRLDQPPYAVNEGPLHGIVFRASIGAPRLSVTQAVLSNVRFLRDYQAGGGIPSAVATPAKITSNTITYQRKRLDAGPGYGLTIRVISGHLMGNSILATSDGRIALEVTALTGDTPLTPLPLAQLLNAKAGPDPIPRNALAFLSYGEKFLAGSWRFNTYFGRDTLMSIRLLMPVLQTRAVEAGLQSVLARLSPAGEVAHEEGIGEFAIVENRKAMRDGAAAQLDYGMVDEDYMLGPVAADYLLGMGHNRARQWLAQRVVSESMPRTQDTVGATLVRNLRFILRQAAPFSMTPSVHTLIAIKSGRMTGEWRDSSEGLGRGVYAYDVNAALVPAAVDAADRLMRAGLLAPYFAPGDRKLFAQAATIGTIWRDRAARLFRVEIPTAAARAAVRAYGSSLGVPTGAAIASIDRPLVFHALSLDKEGRPVPILNSDEGFALLFGRPPAAALDTYIEALMRPFPAGLMTDIGLLVANPAFASDDARTRFTASAYHGAVVWSWQQALLAAGLERQLLRRDLPAGTRMRLLKAQKALWRAISATRRYQSSELWSWTYRDGRYQVVPFGAGKADVDESNAAQLWSTVYLAVQPPGRLRR